MECSNDPVRTRVVLERVCLLLAAGVAVGLLVLATGRIGYGLDRTDEGQYLLLMADPGSDPATVFLFGHLLHPLYAVLAGDIRSLRFVALAVTALVLGLLMLTTARRLGVDRAAVAALSLAGAGMTPLAFAWLPLTPSYNTVALWGVALVGIGVLSGTAPGLRWTGWATTGLGVVLAAVGKPTTGAATLVICALAALLARRARDPDTRTNPLWSLLVGLLTGALAFLLLAGRHPRTLVDTLLAGARGVDRLGGHERLVRWDTLSLTTGPSALQVLLLVGLGTLLALVILAVPAPRSQGVSHGELLPATVLFILPFSYAFGTNGNLWTASARAAPLWLAVLLLALAGIRVGRPDAARIPVAATAALTLLLTAGVVLTGRDTYYRYPSPDPANTIETVIDRAGHRLSLTAADARSTEELLTAGSSLVGADILDTTGASPGYIHQLGARPLGSTWLLGGYPGSAVVARDKLALVPCERLTAAAVLYSPDSPRRINSIWTDLGVDPHRDYRILTEFTHHLGWRVQLLQPTESVARTLTCPGSTATQP